MKEIIERLSAALAERYRIERELGAGGMAMVLLARDLKHDREVALKVFRPDVAAALGTERFLREIRISAHLDHPHILTLIDSGEEAGILYYVLPYVRGESLRVRLEREGRLPVEEALAITIQVASALDYAHRHGIIHRDIKPENILIHEGEAMVADFGIALAVSEAGGTRLTATGFNFGTPQYMSPEQATGERDVDARSDVYSLGAVLYEMLAGEPPHTGKTVQAVLARLVAERPTSLRVLRPAVPDSIDDTVQKALAKTPADRFPTVAAFAEALAGRGAADARHRPRLVTGLAAHWRRARAGIAGLALLLLVAGIWWSRQHAARGITTSGADPRRVAVLYFRSSPGDSLQSVADGFTEGLIHELGRVSSLHVISANGVLPYRDGRTPLDSIGRALGVGSLVGGTVARVGDQLRVDVSLVNATEGTVVESTRLERPEDEVIALQDSLTANVALFLRQRLGEEVHMQQERRRASNPEAWRLVQRARDGARAFDSLVNAGDTTLARLTLAQTDSLLGRAAALDPRWAAPLTERGWLAWHSRFLVGPIDPTWTDRWTTRALHYANAALALAPGDAHALALRGVARYFRYVLNLGSSDPAAVDAAGDSAEADLRAATSADPTQVYAWDLLSHRLMHTGRNAEAKLAALQAYQADPYADDMATIIWRLYSASLDLGDRVESHRWCAEGQARFPGDPSFVECQITENALPGSKPDIPHMWRLLDEYVRLYPPNQQEHRRHYAEMLVAFTLMRAGLPDSARAVALRARADASIDPSLDLVNLEMILRNLLGDREEALRLAAVYFAEHPAERSDCSNSGEPGWEMRGLAQDPRYRALACSKR